MSAVIWDIEFLKYKSVWDMRFDEGARTGHCGGSGMPQIWGKISLKQSSKAKEGTFICARHIHLCDYIWKQKMHIWDQFVSTDQGALPCRWIIRCIYMSGLIQCLGRVTLATGITHIRIAIFDKRARCKAKIAHLIHVKDNVHICITYSFVCW